MATRYSMLPSQILDQADTLDYLVMDASMSWEIECRSNAEGRAQGKPPDRSHIPVNKLQEMMDKVRANERKES